MIHTENIIIKTPSNDLFSYLKQEENHPTWGINFITNYEKTEKGHFVTTPMGRVSLIIKSEPQTGVIDIVLGDKPTHTRVVALSANESLYSFTLILPDHMPKTEIDRGIAGLKEELVILKTIMEENP